MTDCIQKGLVYAIIPARSGSTAIRHKNIRLLGGHPMMAYSIAAAKLVPEIARAIVSTDSEQYAEIARKYGAEAPFLRPPEISGKLATDFEFMEHAINWLQEREGVLPEYWVHLRPTAPLRDPQVVSSALERMMADPSADSLRSAHLADVCPFKWFWKSDDGYFQTFNGISLDEANGPRQGFPFMYIPNGYVDVLKTACILQKHLLHGQKMIAFETPAVVDVDSMDDLNQLEKAAPNVDGRIAVFLGQFGEKGQS